MKTRNEIIVICKKLFLDWLNNSLTVNYLCKHYSLDRKTCEMMLSIGRHYHEKQLTRLDTRSKTNQWR